MKRLTRSLTTLGAAMGLACAMSALAATPAATQSMQATSVTLAPGNIYPMADNVTITRNGADFLARYCSVSYVQAVHPITRVTGMGINNASDATLDASPSLEDFTTLVGQVQTGELVDVSVKGLTVGDRAEGVKVYIDWNQDGLFDNATEGYVIGYLAYSTGSDSKRVSAAIRVPRSAKTGETRMRVIKAFDLMANPWSCNEGEAKWGQAEDYTLYVGGLQSDAIFCSSFEEGEDGSCDSTPAHIVYSGPRNFAISPSGFSVNFVTGEMSSGSVAGLDLAIAQGDPYLWGPVMYFIWGSEENAGVASATVRSYLVLGPGDTIGPSSTFIRDGWGQSTAFFNYWRGMNGYLGVKFMNEDTGEVNYGYVHMLTTSGTGFPAMIMDYAYDNTGAAITIP